MKVENIRPLQDLASHTEQKDNKVFQRSKRANDKTSIKKVAEDFESIFLEILLKSMRKTVVKSGFLDGGNAEGIYKDMLDSEYAKNMASASGENSLSFQIEKQLLGVLDKNNQKVAINSYSKTEGKE